MSQRVGQELTEALWNRLNGQDMTPHEGKIIPIFTLDDLGWPHPALLSYYEVVAKNRSTLDIALWKNSSTAKNLRRAAKLTVMITDKGVNYYLKGSVRELEITSGLAYRRSTQHETTDFSVKVFELLRREP
jgi:hypothetical protein